MSARLKKATAKKAVAKKATAKKATAKKAAVKKAVAAPVPQPATRARPMPTSPASTMSTF